MPRTSYNGAAIRRARRRKRQRALRLFMSGALLSLIIITVMTFVFGKSIGLFENEPGYMYSQISDTGATAPIDSSSLNSDTPDTPQQSGNGFIICVDPGHGFSDPGTNYDDVLESEINLAVSLKLRDLLTSYGFEVIMTRETNEPADGPLLSLAERSSIANSNSADLFISLHCNSFADDESVSGIRIYHYTDAPEESIKYTETIATAVSEELDASCPIFAENYHVIREVTMPAALIEMGFITNAGDRALFVDEEWQQNMALGIANGIEDFYNDLNR